MKDEFVVSNVSSAIAIRHLFVYAIHTNHGTSKSPNYE